MRIVSKKAIKPLHTESAHTIRKYAVFMLASGFLCLSGLTTVAKADPAVMIPAPSPAVVDQPQNNKTVEQTQNNKINASINDITKNIAAIEDKTTTNAKSVIKKLDASSEAVTLDDLNSARQAVVRLEAMIDVEKHLDELEKLRGDHGSSGSSHTLAAAIPASALTPPPMPSSVPITTSVSMPAQPVTASRPYTHSTSSSRIEVSRITGIGGVYVAALKLDDGTVKSFRVGDHISDQSVVRAISASTVVLDSNGETRNLRVKNVDAVYSAMR